MSGFLSRVRAGKTPFFSALKRLVRWLFHTTLPVPRILRPIFRFLYDVHYTLLIGARWSLNCFYRGPLFRSRCAHVGKDFQLTLMPWVSGPVEIHIGDRVSFYGKVDITSTFRVCEKPQLVIKDHSGLGHNVTISVAKEVVIEEDVLVANECRISDNDRHPKDALLRAKRAPVASKDARPVRISRYAWVGQGCYIMKGVTIGEGAIIGANSVVVSNIPPYCVAMGNPAQVYFKNVGRPRSPVSTPDKEESQQAHGHPAPSHRTRQAPQE